MKEIDAKHINVLEFPKLILWTDRDLEYFLEEMSSEECRMNNDVYDALVKEVKAGQDYSLEEAFNLAYYECVRISWAKYPESKDLFYVLEMDIQNNQSHVDYGYTDLIMNMVWAMLHSTNTAKRFADKLHSYLYNNNKLKFNFRYFFTPNDYEPIIYPCEEKEEPRYNVNFSPCPEDIQYNSSNGEWCELTKGYKEHLIEELLLLWPEDKREYIRKCIMDEKAGQSEKFKDFAKKHIVEIIDEPESHLHVNLKESNIDQSVEDEINQLKKECDEWKAKHAKLERILQARTDDESKIDSEYMPGGIKPADDRIIDVIKILHAMCKIGLFQKTNGSKITTKAVMEYFGKMLNKDFSKYSSNLSTSKSKTKELSYMQVFNELREAAYDYYKKS